jgi:tetratricopeptide (TPR) repeat protein
MNLSIIKICSIVLLFVAPVALIYSNILEAPFVLDDTVRIQDNPHIRITNLSIKEIVKAGWNKESASKRPIGNMSFALNYYFHQYNLKGYHVVNIIIHIFAGFFLFLFIKTTLSILSIESKCDHPTLIAFFSALIWLVHPVQTQSVTYIIQRLNSLAAMFYVLSFWLYVKGRLAQKQNFRELKPDKIAKIKAQPIKENTPPETRNPKPETSYYYLWFAGSVLAWILALGCKQNAATLPFFIVLYEWYFFQNLRKQWFKRHLKYFLGIFVLFLFISLIYLGSDPWEKISNIGDYAKNEFTIKERALTQPRVVIYYLSLIVFPHPSRLNLDYDFPLSHSLINPITTLLSLGIIVGLLGLAVYMAKKERLLSFCILWFLGNLVIESSLIPLAIIFEHRLYLPSMLVCLVAVIWIFRLLNQKWLGVALLCAVAMLFSFWTYERNSMWVDRVTLWKDCVQKSPNKARPHYNLGKALVAQNRLSEAIDQYFEASRVNPDDPDTQNNIGNVLSKQGKENEASHYFSEALRIEPDHLLANYNLGSALAEQGQTDEAKKYLFEALRIDPDYGQAHNNLGGVLAAEGKIDQAIGHFSRAIQLDPDNEEAHSNLGNALFSQGKVKEAIRHYSEALRINPDNAQTHCQTGTALAEQGELTGAIRHYSEALRIQPEYAEAHNNLGIALAEQDNVSEAIRHYAEALGINPDYTEAHYNLGMALERTGQIAAAVAQYQKALSIQPDSLQTLNRLAVIYATRKEYDRALSFYKQMIAFEPEHAATAYNIACMNARRNKVEESVKWLRQAVNSGYSNWDLIRTDQDLENIRGSKYYKDLMRGH